MSGIPPTRIPFRPAPAGNPGPGPGPAPDADPIAQAIALGRDRAAAGLRARAASTGSAQALPPARIPQPGMALQAALRRYVQPGQDLARSTVELHQCNDYGDLRFDRLQAPLARLVFAMPSRAWEVLASTRIERVRLPPIQRAEQLKEVLPRLEQVAGLRELVVQAAPDSDLDLRTLDLGGPRTFKIIHLKKSTVESAADGKQAKRRAGSARERAASLPASTPPTTPDHHRGLMSPAIEPERQPGLPPRKRED